MGRVSKQVKALHSESEGFPVQTPLNTQPSNGTQPRYETPGDPRVKISNTGQKLKFSIKDFFSKCDQIRSFLRIWSHLLKKSYLENFIFVQCNCKAVINIGLGGCFRQGSQVADKKNTYQGGELLGESESSQMSLRQFNLWNYFSISGFQHP